jgi:4-oxalocrotonate tautomerase
MPIINVKIAHPEGSSLIPRAAALATDLTARILGKDPKLTAVVVDNVPPSQWFVAGRSLAELGQASFFLEVRIVDGTNTKDQKAQYVAEVFGAFGELLGALHPESYVHVVEAIADAYGFGGLTQEHRYVKKQLAGARQS